MNSVSPGQSSRRTRASFFLLPLLLISSVNAISNGSVENGTDGLLLCPPLVCSCNNVDLSANCSNRGFLSIPPALPSVIRNLDLSHNDLEAINGSELLRLDDLESLDLSFNRLTELHLVGIHFHLQKLDMSSNNISSVRGLRLEGLVHLSEINLSNNKLISLPPNAFTTSGMLRKLNLKGNRIVSLEPGCLDNLVSLEELYLARNKLSSFPKGIFSNMTHLQQLDLNRNRFVEIRGLSFHGLENLKVLKLKRNQIEYLMDGAFFGLNKIEELMLDRNRVPTVSKGWLYGLTSLKLLSLGYNRVDYINDDAWEFCHELVELDLRSNKLQLLDRFALAKLPSLRKLYLQDNKISHIEGEEDVLKSAFAHVPLLEVLALDGNEISHTIEDMFAPFRRLTNLQALSLSRNQIKSIGNQAFLGLNSLRQLDLTDNLISTIQEYAFGQLQALQSLEINSDSMLCDCYLKWFPRWVNETRIRGVNARCAHPETLKGLSVTRIPYESFTCEDFPKPYILKHPETQITLHGSNLTLLCRAASTSSVDMTFTWKIDSEVIDSLGNGSDCSERCIIQKSHSFDGKGREITSELHLTNLTYDDAGRYQCIVSNEYGTTYSDRANITVYVYPSFIVTPEDITVSSGSSATMKCAAQGVPAPKVAWSKDSGSDFPAASERRITFNTFPIDQERRSIINSFIIRNVKAIDMGVYSCTASNPAGSISWNITLSVLEAPRFVKPMEDKICYKDDTAVLECMVSGSPKPRLTWTKDGQKLMPTERHFFAADNQLLIIVKAQTSDAGSYHCSVQNSLGTETQTSILTVRVKDNLHLSARNGTVASNSFSLPVETVAIIVIAVVACIAGTSLVWLMFLCKSRRHRRRNPSRSRRGSAPDPNVVRRKVSETIQQPLFVVNQHCKVADVVLQQPVDVAAAPSVVNDSQPETDSPSHSFEPGEESARNWDSSSDRDSGTGDSKKSNDIVDVDDDGVELGFDLAAVANQGGGESRISLADFEVTATTLADSAEMFPYVDDDAEEDTYKVDSGCGEVLVSSRPASFLSVGLHNNVLKSHSDESASGSSHPISSRVENKVSDKNAGTVDTNASHLIDKSVPFRTFRPFLCSQNNLNYCDSHSSSLSNVSPRKRASAIELNGECYLAIEAVDALAAETPDPVLYRGGVGTELPKQGLELQQRLLEESLTNSEYALSDNSRLSLRRQSKERSSMLSLNGKGGRKMSNYESLPRRKTKNATKYKKLMSHLSPDEDRSSVANKSSDMFS